MLYALIINLFYVFLDLNPNNRKNPVSSGEDQMSLGPSFKYFHLE